MKILPQAGDLVRPVFLELVQTTGTDTTYCRTTYGCNSSFFQKWKILPKMENFAKNGKFCQKWKILPKMENFAKNGKYWKLAVSAKNGKYWKLAVVATEC